MSEDNLFPNVEASEMYIVYYVIEPSVPGEGKGGYSLRWKALPERGIFFTPHMKGYRFHLLKCVKGYNNLSFRSAKRPRRANG